MVYIFLIVTINRIRLGVYLVLNKDIPKERLNKIKLLVLDSDGVTVERGTRIVEKETDKHWTAEIKTNKMSGEISEMINQLKKRGIKVMISSGRGLIYLQSMYPKVIGDGTILQAENGSISLFGGKIVQHFDYPENYFKKIARIKDKIKKLPIHGFEPKQFILTVHSPEEFKEVYEIVKREDTEGELRVMWNGEAFDIQKKEISKGEGLKKIIEHLGIKKDEVLAIGDRVNDKELLDMAGIGVSADKEKLESEYWTEGQELGANQLLAYLLENIN